MKIGEQIRRPRTWVIAELTMVLAICALTAARPVKATATESESSGTTRDEEAVRVEQEMLPLKVHVVDEQGRAIPRAKVSPWALSGSQGHGLWDKDDKAAGVAPESVLTDGNGLATVLYPRYRRLDEQVSTITVSLFVDHTKFGYIDNLHIDVPLEESGPYQIELKRGVAVEIRPTINGATADHDSLFVFWSDGRSWQPDAKPEKEANGILRIPAMPPGRNSVLLAKLDGDRATHFSDIVDLELTAGPSPRIDVPLRPALRVEGVISESVPRPVRDGRIKAQTLPPSGAADQRVGWFTWAPIRPDGTFTIESWPYSELIQLIALCDGYIASPGKAPDVVANPRSPDQDPYGRPQVFNPSDYKRIEVKMTPLVRCVATAVDEEGAPVAGVKVVSWPNVGWWNGGSQIYCHPLVRGERLLRERKYYNSLDEAFPNPFESQTSADGRVTLQLPAGRERLAIFSDVYELPIFLGRRDISIQLTPSETTVATLRLQARGTELLGEWDKLAGVVFGCSTREGQRIRALPGVKGQMEEFVRIFRDAKSQQDPKLLSEAYYTVADAFLEAGDAKEALNWQRKADEEADKVEEP